MLVETDLNWSQAEEYCDNKNEYLAELNEPEEKDAVWNYARGEIWCIFFANNSYFHLVFVPIA